MQSRRKRGSGRNLDRRKWKSTDGRRPAAGCGVRAIGRGKTEEEVVVAEPVQKQQEKIPETTEPEIETAETEEPPEFIEIEMEEEHNWEYECRKILESHTAMYPFSDDEVDQCVQIGPEDFGEFPQRYWTLSENPFLKQGFYNFGHLLFTKVGERVFVGVPGRYHKGMFISADRMDFRILRVCIKAS